MDSKELTEQVQMLHEVHSRRLSDRALEMWVEALQEFRPAIVESAIKAACRERMFPGLGWVIEAATAIRRRETEIKRTEELLQRLDGSADRESASVKADAEKFFAEMRQKLGIGTDDIVKNIPKT